MRQMTSTTSMQSPSLICLQSKKIDRDCATISRWSVERSFSLPLIIGVMRMLSVELWL